MAQDPHVRNVFAPAMRVFLPGRGAEATSRDSDAHVASKALHHSLIAATRTTDMQAGKLEIMGKELKIPSMLS